MNLTMTMTQLIKARVFLSFFQAIAALCKLGFSAPETNTRTRAHVRHDSLEAVIQALLGRIVGRERGAMSVEVSLRSVVFVTAVMTALIVR